MPIDANKLGAAKAQDEPVIIRHVLEFTEEEYVRFSNLLTEAENELTPGDAPIYGHYKAARVRAKIADGHYNSSKEVSRG